MKKNTNKKFNSIRKDTQDHVTEAALKRYDITLSRKAQEELVRLLQSKQIDTMPVSISLSRTVHLMPYRKMLLPMVYSKKRKCFVTVLPKDDPLVMQRYSNAMRNGNRNK